MAADGLRATLLVPNRGKTVIPFSQMSPTDAAYVQDWRKANPKAPLIDPERLAPWPAEVLAESIDVKMTGEDAAASHFTYESAHFVIECDLKLPVAVVGDIAAVFEATRAALISLPLGLHLGNESRKYPVSMLYNPADVRRGIPRPEAESKHLLRGHPRENLAGEVQNYARKLGLTLKIEPVTLPPLPHLRAQNENFLLPSVNSSPYCAALHKRI